MSEETRQLTTAYEVPLEFFVESWEDADHPMACVGIDNNFVKVNSAFERMLGYSSEELRGKSWISFTKDEHVGGDLASIKAVIEGRLESYYLEKDYRHKRGHYVPVALAVRRYPRHATSTLAYFRVEAPIAVATRPEIGEMRHDMMEVIVQLRDRLAKVEERGFVQVGDTWRDGDKTGRDRSDKIANKITNEATTMQYMAAMMGVVVIALIWVVYYVATIVKDVEPKSPPEIYYRNSGGEVGVK